MELLRGVGVLALCGALAGCSLFGGGPSASSPPPSSSVTPSSARDGIGGSASAKPVVSETHEVFFRTPSKNIFCHLSDDGVRCDILHKEWKPPAKPADCELDYGFGLYIAQGTVGFTCTGDSLASTATTTLEYGDAYHAGQVLCESEWTGLTCKDEKSGRGFTLAVAAYRLF